MIKIVHIIKAHGVIAGAENHLLSLLPSLDRSKFDVCLLALTQLGRPVPDLVSGMHSRGVPTQRLGILADVDLTLIPRLAFKIRKMRPDVVHTHLVHADLYGSIAARIAGVPLLISSRHNDDPFRHSGMVARLVKLANLYVDHFVAISDHVREFTVTVEGVDTKRVTTVHYGLKPRSPTIMPDIRTKFGLGDGPVLMCVARLTPQKGHRLLLTALQSVVRKIPTVQLLLIGDGPLRVELESLTSKLGLEGNVVFSGWRTDAPNLLYGADLFVLPSLWEGFGLVLLEAMAASLAIVATRVGSISEIVLHDHTGLLVEPGNDDDLANAIITLMGSSHERARLGNQGRIRLEGEFSVKSMVDAMEAIYLDSLSSRKEFATSTGESTERVSARTIT